MRRLLWTIIGLAVALPAAAQGDAPLADFEDVDIDGDQLISRDEARLQNFEQAFDNLNQNRDKFLDPQEFATMGPPLGERDTIYETGEGNRVAPVLTDQPEFEDSEADATDTEIAALRRQVEELTAEVRRLREQQAGPAE